MKRVCIVGTAQSWQQTPWSDPGLEMWSLNDAYRMQGFVRADRWFDFHPPDKWWTAPQGNVVYAHQVPPGHYVRPAGHKEWLLNQSIPVYLHPDYRTAWPEAADKRHVRPFPKAEIEAAYGDYFTSSPAWMLALAHLEGARDIWITGIHLATEHEYIEQRPNFEALISLVLGSGKRTKTIKDGFRHYESPDAHIALPEASPIFQSDFQYAFQPRPRAALEPLKWEAHKLTIKRERAIETLRTAPWWKPTKATQDELLILNAKLQDTQEQMQRMTMGA